MKFTCALIAACTIATLSSAAAIAETQQEVDIEQVLDQLSMLAYEGRSIQIMQGNDTWDDKVFCFCTHL